MPSQIKQGAQYYAEMPGCPELQLDFMVPLGVCGPVASQGDGTDCGTATLTMPGWRYAGSVSPEPGAVTFTRTPWDFLRVLISTNGNR